MSKKKTAKKNSKKTSKKVKFNKGGPYEVEWVCTEPSNRNLSSFGNWLVSLLKKMIGR